MGSQALVAALRDVFKHSEFKSVLQREAIECINGGEYLTNYKLYPPTIIFTLEVASSEEQGITLVDGYSVI